MIKATKTCFRKYFVLRGRATRAEYWWFYLATILASLSALITDGLIWGFSEDPGPIEIVISLAIIIPSITVMVRRLHDTGKSGYYVLFPLVGIIAGIAFGALLGPSMGQPASYGAGFIIVSGFILQLWWLVKPSQPNSNKFGPNPHEVSP
ncbi:MAG: DUF805 domain-containing protein [Rhodobacteraceae bacterium]|nr:DUF805 domain-containing protein [Paracoccaceae bacterium]